MHFYTMTIREETEGSNQSELKLWANDQDKIYLEVGPINNEDAPYHMGFITLTPDDVRALINELTRLVNEIEPADTSPKDQLTLTPPSHNLSTGQLPLPSKVNWSK